MVFSLSLQVLFSLSLPSHILVAAFDAAAAAVAADPESR